MAELETAPTTSDCHNNEMILDSKVLDGVVVYAEVRSASDNRTKSVQRELSKLGAIIANKFTNDVTHVVFKEGTKRTLTKAQKNGVHLVSVLWVEDCKINQEKMPEKMYPAIVPKLKGTPLLMRNKKRAKCMQPVTFDEELASSTERMRKKRRRQDAMRERLASCEHTPSSSPRPVVLVQDTQPRSPDDDEDDYVLTPIRLTIPDTPPSMREKMNQIRLAREARLAAQQTDTEGATTTTDDGHDDDDDVNLETFERHMHMQHLQKKLFKLSGLSQEGASDSSVDKELADMARNINCTLNHSGSSSPGSFGSQHLLSSQEISSVVNSKVKFTSITPKSPIESGYSGSSKGNITKAGKEKENDEIDCLLNELNDSEDKNAERKVDVDEVSPVIEVIETKKIPPKKRGRVSKKMSVRQAVNELDVSNNMTPTQAERVDKEFEEENPISEPINVSGNAGKRDSSMKERNTSQGKKGSQSVTKEMKACAKKPVSKRGGRSSRNNLNNSDLDKSEMGNTMEEIRKEVHDSVDNSDMDEIRKQNDVREGDTKMTKDKPVRRRRSIANTQDAQSQGQSCVEVKVESEDRGKVGKRTMKKKLLSLTDLLDRHSILTEPTKCSQVARPQLISSQEEKKATRGKKKLGPASKKMEKNGDVDGSTTTPGNVSSNIDNESKDETESSKAGAKSTNGESSDENTETIVLDVQQEGKYKNSKTKKSRCKSDVTDESGVNTQSRRKRNVGNGANKSSQAKKGKTVTNTLVNDTHNDDENADELVDSSNQSLPRHGSSIFENKGTTNLDLTKENSLVCSIRETTLSLSMSTAYADGTLPSFLQRDRRSVDEFNLSQQRKANKKKARKRTVLSSVSENSPDGKKSSSSGSDTSVSGHKKVRLNSSTGRSKYVRASLVMTSLHSHEQDVVISVVKKLGGFVIAEAVNETTTHVICGDPRRTLNILHCLARGIWLLSKEWVLNSLSAGEWIPETEFEMDKFFPMCKVARLEREASADYFRQTIFSDAGPIYVSGRVSPPRDQLVQLLKLCGGKVTEARSKASVYVGTDYHPGLTCVKTIWLLDCITNHRLMPMEKYFLDRPKRESSPVY